ncbi:MAG: SDR family oxidoreductase [Bacteroidales bacterium]|nr:SDR family oxidoreductase [Bacteroidales bacterium]
MDLQLTGKVFIVTGAGSGFGNAIARALARENAEVIAISRTAEKLAPLQQMYPRLITTLAGDITQPRFLKKVLPFIDEKMLGGIVLNAGGPPVKKAADCKPADADNAYSLLFRWKMEWLNELIPLFVQQQYGKIVSIESISVKHPLPSLVLSTSLRLAVTGYLKTLASETAAMGITINILAPGYHDTPALNRILENTAAEKQISVEEARQKLQESVPVKKLGNPDHLASLALFLLSPLSEFITGQTFSIDGGSNPYLFG